jgi:hypothetical protein
MLVHEHGQGNAQDRQEHDRRQRHLSIRRERGHRDPALPITTVAGTGTTGLFTVTAGSYSIGENAATGWALVERRL